MTIASPRHRADDTLPGRLALIYLSAFALALLLLPASVVIPGALKSNGSPAVLLALASFGIVLLNITVSRRAALAPTGATVLAIVAALEVTTWVSGYVRVGDAVVKASETRGLLAVFGYTGIALLTMFTMSEREQRRRLLVVTVLGLCYDGFIGILQSAFSINERLLLMPPGFVLNKGFLQATRDGTARATGTADSPIEYAVLMAVLIALSLYLVRREQNSWTRLLGVIGFVIGVVGVPASVSRTAVVALAGATLTYLICSRLREFASGVLVVGVILLGFVLAVPTRAGQLTDLFTQASSDDSITGRTSDYSVVFQEFGHHPWFGAGLGSNPPSQSRYLDNQWLQAMVEGGTIGVVALAILFLGAAVAGISAVRVAGAGIPRREATAYLAAMMAVFTSSFTFDLYAFNQAKYVFFLIFGLSCAALGAREMGQPMERSSAHRELLAS